MEIFLSEIDYGDLIRRHQIKEPMMCDIEEVRQMLSKTKGSMVEVIIAEQEERF